jgi:recombination DNA repair RAD52 pathway protein
MMKKDYEIKREIWAFEDEYNMNNFYKMISQLNFKQRRILEEVDKMKIPLKRGSETKMEDENQSRVAKTEILIKNSTPDYQPVQYPPSRTWPERDMYTSNQTNSNDYNNASYNSIKHSPCENSPNFNQLYENFNSCKKFFLNFKVWINFLY